MTDTETKPNRRVYHILAVVMLLLCIDALTGTPKYFSSAAYLTMALVFSIKGFTEYESRPWGRAAIISLNVAAVLFMVISLGRRFLA